MAPHAFVLPPGDPTPNHPFLPVLWYEQVLTVGGELDAAATAERLLDQNAWPARWRNGVYPFHHYHSTAHEVLVIARGSARLLLGGKAGREVTVRAGDVLVLPAGTGHCRTAGSADLLVVGGYPPGQEADLRRESAGVSTLTRIRTVPLPASDPVAGPHGPLLALWQATRVSPE